jgi:drug/metabolite transporter (DMT)-like permease
MNPIGIVLVAISCVSHSSWNLLAKRNVQQGDFFWWMLLAITVALALPGAVGLWFFPLPPRCVALVGGSSLFIGCYFAALSMSYRRGDMSIIYPLARSVRLFLLAWMAILMGEQFDAYGYFGIALVVIGAVVLPMVTGRGWGRWFNSGNLWAMAPALATTGYSL